MVINKDISINTMEYIQPEMKMATFFFDVRQFIDLNP
jgi:hypothetical protein